MLQGGETVAPVQSQRHESSRWPGALYLQTIRRGQRATQQPGQIILALQRAAAEITILPVAARRKTHGLGPFRCSPGGIGGIRKAPAMRQQDAVIRPPCQHGIQQWIEQIGLPVDPSRHDQARSVARSRGLRQCSPQTKRGRCQRSLPRCIQPGWVPKAAQQPC